MASGGRNGKGARAWRPRQVGELVSDVLDPVLEKRAGVSASLLHNWDDVIGSRLAGATLPQKVQWPRRASEDDPFQPATLTIAADPSVAFILQHETGEVIARVNAFLGFAAIARIRIVQKPVGQARETKKPSRPLGEAAKRRIGSAVAPIEDDDLRKALEALGENVFRKSRSD